MSENGMFGGYATYVAKSKSCGGTINPRTHQSTSWGSSVDPTCKVLLDYVLCIQVSPGCKGCATSLLGWESERLVFLSGIDLELHVSSGDMRHNGC